MVEWKKLKDFAKVEKTKNRKHITEKAYSITQLGLIPSNSFFKEKTNITSSDTSGYYIVEKDWFVYSPSRIDVGSINYLKDEGPVIVSPIDVVFSIDKNMCIPSFLLNYFFTYEGKRKLLRNREGVEGMGRRNLPFTAIETMSIPIPSLEEQNRIVGILDTFTDSIENLKEQIKQRRKQYEYYRDQLLDLEWKEGVEMKKLGEICDIGTGSNNREDSVENGLYPFFVRSKDVLRINDFLYDEEAILIPGEGGIGEIFHYYKGKYGLHQRAYRVHPISNNVIGRYLYFYLFANFKTYIDKKSFKATATSIRKPMLIEFPVAIPPLEEQNRIVGILDTFTDTMENLIEQLKQREKQYEYYRNKLLTFE